MSTTLDDNAIKTLLEAGKQLANPIIKAADEPPGWYYLRQGDGSLTRVRAEPVNRQHAMGDLESLISFLKDDPELPEDLARTTVWCGRESVTVLLDDEDRRDRITLELAFTPQWLKLLELTEEPPKPWEHKQLLRFLRDLIPAFRSEDLAVLRQIRLRAQTDTEMSVSHSKESLGKRVMAEASGVTDLPEYLEAQVPVYQTPGEDLVAAITCDLDIDTIEGKFYLVPRAQDFENALQRADESRMRRLREGLAGLPKIQVYRGVP